MPRTPTASRVFDHQVKPYEDGPAIDTVSGNSSSTTRRYYRSYRSDLGVSGVYDRGDRISFECDVAGATVRLNGERIGTTSAATTPSESTRMTATGTTV